MKQFLENYEPKQERSTSNEAEPRVLTEDVAEVLRKVVRPDDDDLGSSVLLVAEKASTSTRTVYRVLSQSTPTINLDLADRLCIAANSHLSQCRLRFSDGTVRPYAEDSNVVEIVGIIKR